MRKISEDRIIFFCETLDFFNDGGETDENLGLALGETWMVSRWNSKSLLARDGPRPWVD